MSCGSVRAAIYIIKSHALFLIRTTFHRRCGHFCSDRVLPNVKHVHSLKHFAQTHQQSCVFIRLVPDALTLFQIFCSLLGPYTTHRAHCMLHFWIAAVVFVHIRTEVLQSHARVLLCWVWHEKRTKRWKEKDCHIKKQVSCVVSLFENSAPFQGRSSPSRLSEWLSCCLKTCKRKQSEKKKNPYI